MKYALILLAVPAAAIAQAPQVVAPTLPAAVPVYPGATITEAETEADGDINVTFTTPASVAQVREFYAQRMKAAGLDATNRSLFAGSAKLRASDAAQRYEVEIERDGRLTEVEIEIDRRP